VFRLPYSAFLDSTRQPDVLPFDCEPPSHLMLSQSKSSDWYELNMIIRHHVIILYPFFIYNISRCAVPKFRSPEHSTSSMELISSPAPIKKLRMPAKPLRPAGNKRKTSLSRGGKRERQQNQLSVRRMLVLASLKSGKETMKVGGEPVSLTQLQVSSQYLPNDSGTHQCNFLRSLIETRHFCFPLFFNMERLFH